MKGRRPEHMAMPASHSDTPSRSSSSGRRVVRSGDFIAQQVDRTRRAVKAVDVATGVLVLVTAWLASLLVIAVVEHWFVPGGLGAPIRGGLLVALVAGSGYFTWRWLWPHLAGSVNPAFAAHTIEKSNPSLKNSLLNFLLVGRHREQVPSTVYRTLEQQAAGRLAKVAVDSAVDRTRLIQVATVLAAVITVGALYKVFSPKDPFTSARRMFMPWAEISAPSRVSLTNIEPGSTTITRGERVQVTAQVRGLADGERVELRYTTDDARAVDLPVEMHSSDGLHFACDLGSSSASAHPGGVEQSLRYNLSAGDARSREFTINVVDAPTLIVHRVDYDYPQYTGFIDQTVNGQGDLRAIEGTKITLHAQANGPVDEAYLDFEADGRRDLKLEIEDLNARADFTLTLRDDRRSPRYTSYVLRMRSPEGRRNPNPVQHTIEVTPDYAPEIELLAPQEATRNVALNDTVTIEVEARDPDFGLADVRLRAQVRCQTIVDQPLLESPPHTGRFAGRFRFTPSRLGLRAGDEVQYWATADDVRAPEANQASTHRQRLRIIDPQPRRPDEQNQIARGGDNQRGEQPNERGENGNAQRQPSSAEQGEEQGSEAQASEGEGSERQGSEEQGSEGQGSAARDSSSEQSQQADAAGQESRNGNQSGNQQNEGQQQGDSPGDAGGQNGASQGDPSQSQPGSQSSNQRGNENAARGEQPGSSADQNSQAQRGERTGDQSGTGEEAPVSNRGDDDGEAFERIGRHMRDLLDQANERRENNSSDSGEQGNSQSADSQQQSETNSAANNTDSSSGDETSSSEGNQPDNPSEGEGPGAATQPGDPSRDRQQPADDGSADNSPGGEQVRSKGQSGAGDDPGEKQGAPNSSPQMRPRDKWQQDAPGERPDDQEAPAPADGKTESDSQGEQGGDRPGGGQEGGGQKANRDGTGSSGQNQSADEGFGQSAEKGTGETSSTAGDKQTGEQADNPTAGTGRKGDGQRVPNAAHGDNPQAESGETTRGAEDAGEGTSADSSHQGRPADREPNEPNNQESSNQEASRTASDDPAQTAADEGSGGSVTGSGGSRSANPGSAPRGDGAEPGGDEANLEYARRQTDLILDKLADQLNKRQVDQQMLDDLGWSEADLRKFLERWQTRKTAARRDQGDGRQKLDDALRSLGLKPRRLAGETRRTEDQLRDLKEAVRVPVPPEFLQRLREYNQGVSRSSE